MKGYKSSYDIVAYSFILKLLALVPVRCSDRKPACAADRFVFWVVIDRYWVFITDTDYLHVYVPDNRYAEPIFIYCYKVNK